MCDFEILYEYAHRTMCVHLSVYIHKRDILYASCIGITYVYICVYV